MNTIKRPLVVWLGIVSMFCLLGLWFWASAGYSDAEQNTQPTNMTPMDTPHIIQFTDCATMEQVEIYDDGIPDN
jgi:hypothetical protein